MPGLSRFMLRACSDYAERIEKNTEADEIDAAKAP